MVDRGQASAGDGSRLRHGVGIGVAGLLVVFGVYFAVTAFGYGISVPGNPIGPGAVPAGLGVLLVAGAVIIGIGDGRALWRLRGGSAISAGDEDAKAEQSAGGERSAGSEQSTEGRDLLRAILVLALLGVGLALVPLIGMVLGLTVAVMAICAFVERLSPLRVILVGAVAALLLWLVFGVLLSVNFPNSLIGL